MPSIYDDPTLATAREGAQAATAKAASESVNAISLPDQLRSAINSKFSTDNPIYADREGAIKDYFNATTKAPLSVTPVSAGGTSEVVYNPAQQANLIQQYRSPSVARLATLNDLLGLATGGIENVIGATSRAHQGAVAGLNAEAELAQGNYKNIFGELQARQAEIEAARRDASSGSGGLDLSSLIELLSGSNPDIQRKKYSEDVDEYVKLYGVDAAEQQGIIGPRQYK